MNKKYLTPPIDKKPKAGVVHRKYNIKDGAGLAKHKWGVKQGNWMKVHPLDRI